MPNILDVAVNYGKRKNLDQIIRQALRIADVASSKASSYNHLLNEKDHSFKRASKLKQARNDHWLLADNLQEKLIPMNNPNTDGLFDKLYSHLSECDKKFPRDLSGRTSCYKSWWNEELPKFLPTTDDVQSDPLMYVDHFSEYVSDYAKGLIDGSIEYR